MAVVLDEIFSRVWEELQNKFNVDVWAFRHEDDTYTLHWSVNDILIPTDAVPVDPMTAFANPKPLIDKIVKSVEESGIT